jgi:hypothetical protein
MHSTSPRALARPLSLKLPAAAPAAAPACLAWAPQVASCTTTGELVHLAGVNGPHALSAIGSVTGLGGR